MSMCSGSTSEGELLPLLSVQVGGGGDQTGVWVDAEELVARTRQQTVPHHSVLLCRSNTGGQCTFYKMLTLTLTVWENIKTSTPPQIRGKYCTFYFFIGHLLWVKTQLFAH